MVDCPPDVRLNPELMEACQGDIRKFCREFMPKDADQMGGKVLYCLRRRFAIHVNLRASKSQIPDQVGLNPSAFLASSARITLCI